MKVTKLVREYVTEEVHKAFAAKQNPYAEQAKKDEESIRELSNLIKEQQKLLVGEFVEKNEVHSSWSGGPYTVSTLCPSFHDMLTPAMKNARAWREENLRQEARKLREILVSLELGANRDELKSMIEELMKE